MKLGIIAYFENGIIKDEVFQSAKQKGLEFLEFCINVGQDVAAHISQTEKLKALIAEYGLGVGSVGRWGSERILPDGSHNGDELEQEKALIGWCAEIGCPVYVTACNYVESLSLYENCTAAIGYFKELIAYGKTKGVKIAVYNCRWNSFVHSDPAWEIILGHLKDLYIKYDASHCIYAGGNYLEEAKKWGHRFAHVHIKGSLVIGGQRFDDPPAGMDQTNWGAFLAVLYGCGYEGNLSIEPHSEIWTGERGAKGVDYTVNFIRQFMM